MNDITVNASTAEKLRHLSETALICDDRGVVLGEFRPAEKNPANTTDVPRQP